MPNPLPFSVSPIPYVLLSGLCSLSSQFCGEFSKLYSFRGIPQKSYFNSYASPSLVTRYSSLIPYHLSLFVLLFDFKKQSRPRLPACTRHFRASCVLSGHPDMGGRGFINHPSKIFNSCIRFYIITNKTNTSPHICRSIRDFGSKHPQIWGSFVSFSFFFQKRISSFRLNHSTTPRSDYSTKVLPVLGVFQGHCAAACSDPPSFSSLITRPPTTIRLSDYQTL
jgi:hypothetical protein